MATRRDPFAGFAALGLPDALALALRIVTSRRLGGRKKAALLLVLEGLDYRAAARAVGLADHMGIHRVAKRWEGLRAVHAERKAFRQIAQRVAEASAIALNRGSKHAGVSQSLRALTLADDALELLRRLDPRLL